MKSDIHKKLVKLLETLKSFLSEFLQTLFDKISLLIHLKVLYLSGLIFVQRCCIQTRTQGQSIQDPQCTHVSLFG